MEDAQQDGKIVTEGWWRDVALFCGGVVVAPPLLTLMYRLTPTSVGLWAPDLILLGVIAIVLFVFRWRSFAMGMLVSSLLWIGFTLWLTGVASPDW